MKALTAGIFGVIFGLGLWLGGMLDPAKVLGFLDVAGAWNPQLAFVMGGAIAVAAPAFFLMRTRTKALLGEDMPRPPRHPIDRRLIGGSILFGVGWGLSGICPGPGIVLLGLGGLHALVFVAAVIAGAAAAGRLFRA